MKTQNEVIEIHKKLHKSLDSLIACFISENYDKTLTSTNLMELIEWSYKQTQNPTCFKEINK